MGRPVLKVCGVREEIEVESLCRQGVDFFGLLIQAPSPLALTEMRAKQLASQQQQATRATLVSGVHRAEELKRLVESLGVRAVQLGVRVSPREVRTLRDCYREDDLTIIQEIPYRQIPSGEGRFLKENQVSEFLDAGANFILLDKLEKADRDRHEKEGPIAASDLVQFRARNPGIPLLIAASVTRENVVSLLDASGAAGIDVCSSVRRDGLICQKLVAELMEPMAKEPT